VLAPTKQAVLAATAGYGPTRAAAGHASGEGGASVRSWNRSRHDLATLQGDPDNLEKNLRDYVRAFSPNVRDIFEKYKFDETISTWPMICCCRYCSTSRR
jgi:type I restriction enzyme M protein